MSRFTRIFKARKDREKGDSGQLLLRACTGTGLALRLLSALPQERSFAFEELPYIGPYKRLKHVGHGFLVRVGKVRQRFQDVHDVVIGRCEFLLKDVDEFA